MTSAAAEGVATGKVDGTQCQRTSGALLKRARAKVCSTAGAGQKEQDRLIDYIERQEVFDALMQLAWTHSTNLPMGSSQPGHNWKA